MTLHECVPRRGIPDYYVSGHISRVPAGLDVRLSPLGSSAIFTTYYPPAVWQVE